MVSFGRETFLKHIIASCFSKPSWVCERYSRKLDLTSRSAS